MTSSLIRCSSSLRTRPVEETLLLVRPWLERLGITRVTDITRLDHLGIPVYASIRPGAKAGSLCVNAGKGLHPAEARVGACMEAIEFAMAEYGASDIAIVIASARDVLDGHSRPEAILDFCPLFEKQIALDSPLACVEAENIATGDTCLVPAELIFLPTPRHLITERNFGATSNGLSSGNDIEEATLHGLAELIERDITSFYNLRDDSHLVDPATLPGPSAELLERLETRGLRLIVRYMPNPFGIPWFMATLLDPEHPSPFYVNGGCGCHLDAGIALMRAICEAAQSRLSYIHGGRDDLILRYDRFRGNSETENLAFVQKFSESVSNAHSVIRFEEIPDLGEQAINIPSALNCLRERLCSAGIHQVLRVAYTNKDDDLQVVRVLAPGLEIFSETSVRVGPRLKNFLQDLERK